MDEWNQGQDSARVKAVIPLLTSLEQNDAEYLGGKIEREQWIETARAVNDKLAVAGLRLLVLPWSK